jgi:hypothetical protein
MRPTQGFQMQQLARRKGSEIVSAPATKHEKVIRSTHGGGTVGPNRWDVFVCHAANALPQIFPRELRWTSAIAPERFEAGQSKLPCILEALATLVLTRENEKRSFLGLSRFEHLDHTMG